MDDFWLRALPYLVGAVALLGVVMAIRPRWFRTWRIHPFDDPDTFGDEGPGYRIGRMGRGGIRYLGLAMAIVAGIAAVALHVSVDNRMACADARDLWQESGRSMKTAEQRAATMGYRIEVVDQDTGPHGSDAVVYVLDGDRRIAHWTRTAGWAGPRFACDI